MENAFLDAPTKGDVQTARFAPHFGVKKNVVQTTPAQTVRSAKRADTAGLREVVWNRNTAKLPKHTVM